MVSAPAEADTFGSGVNSFSIDFVSIGNAGNTPDTTGQPNPAGVVGYSYRMGTYEISEQMVDKANALGGLGITKDTRGPDKPATSVDWFEAAKFVNWLNTSSGHMPAYKFVTVTRDTPPDVAAAEGFELWQAGDPGYNPNNLYRNSLAMYFLPSANEWYKAAFYDPTSGTYFDYATGSNNPPIAVASGTAAGTAVYNQSLSAGPADIMLAGGLSPYGTMAQDGNVEEWEETELDLVNDTLSASRGRRGGFWEFSALSSPFRNGEPPATGLFGLGFRVVSNVPEPSSAGLFLIGIVAYCFILRPQFLWRVDRA